jgi:hypothetical protein
MEGGKTTCASLKQLCGSDNLQFFWFAAFVKNNLRLFQIAETNAQTPTWIRALVFLSIPFNQFLKKLLIRLGGGML